MKVPDSMVSQWWSALKDVPFEEGMDVAKVYKKFKGNNSSINLAEFLFTRGVLSVLRDTGEIPKRLTTEADVDHALVFVRKAFEDFGRIYQ